ncbi:EbsA family protein [Melissococcus plutonius]|uniref:Conjugation pore forming protein EbsA n=1 Tax=Melissococcus plutonius TaxID=33970 RepID=A0A2Z5Y269_9ENTE|nr:EbsA family protein [Melissococcus plutonius]BAL62029.1 EbsA protein [Melissococcus plutonius DAT561]MCV2499152.1 EbsA family protein [Melissococcus plutonius]MCV2500338.1 EbsA family protein [Melissococcus plutonius]MCV2505131.1 EbsA family protein [Melissococcus plutonius]MCV2507657.1 EbsA family protein [Melissococcus plutonius]
MKKKIYHWQPELASTIIYWSFTFGILFISLILSLEHTHPYLISNLVLAIFFFFFVLGFKRYFKIEKNNLFIYTLFSLNNKRVPFSSITKIQIEKRRIEIYSKAFKNDSQTFLMMKKTRDQFIAELLDYKKDMVVENQEIAKS